MANSLVSSAVRQFHTNKQIHTERNTLCYTNAYNKACREKESQPYEVIQVFIWSSACICQHNPWRHARLDPPLPPCRPFTHGDKQSRGKNTEFIGVEEIYIGGVNLPNQRKYIQYTTTLYVMAERLKVAGRAPCSRTPSSLAKSREVSGHNLENSQVSVYNVYIAS